MVWRILDGENLGLRAWRDVEVRRVG